jgi:hypothetical protein
VQLKIILELGPHSQTADHAAKRLRELADDLELHGASQNTTLSPSDMGKLSDGTLCVGSWEVTR